MFKSNQINLLKEEFDSNKNSHSYIFYTNDFFCCQNDIYNLIKYIYKCDNLEYLSSDLYVIKSSTKRNIVKEEINGLKDFLKTTTYLNKKKLYLIEEAHKLNTTSANMILKCLEEPTDGVIALFITDNLDAVLNTIKSRCQIVNVFYDKLAQETTFINNELYNLIFYSNKYKTLLNIKKNLEKYDRDQLVDLFKSTINTIISKNEINKLYNIKILNEAITMLNANVNIDYIFDYILLKRSE